jgi:ribonuclease-3
MAEAPLEVLQTRIGYRFQNLQLLIEALTHSSYAREASDHTRDNEQMEFLGDAVLSFVVSARLTETFPEIMEGRLSRARSRLVSTSHLAMVGARLELGEYLRLGRGEEKTGGRAKAALQVNAVEALLAALYRDGGLAVAGEFIQRFILPEDLAGSADDLFSIDYKSALQEYLQAEHAAAAEYRVVDESGPEHRKTFTVEVTGGDNLVARGGGASKKAAEQQAARAVLERLGKRPEANG